MLIGLEPGDPVTWFRSVGGSFQFIHAEYVGPAIKGRDSVRIRVRTPEGGETIRSVRTENIDRGHRAVTGSIQTLG